MNGEDYDAEEALAFESDETLVVRTKDEGCDCCGNEPFALLAPEGDDFAGAFRDGILVCEECYDGDDHYDTDQFELMEFEQ